MRDRHIYLDKDQQDKIMREAMKLFNNINQDKMNKVGHTNIFDTTLDEFLQLLKEKQLGGHLIDLLSILREYKEDQRYVKILCQLSQERNTTEFNLEINGNMIKEVVVNFGSQVNILPRETWIQLRKPLLQPTMNFLKLVDQRFIEPISTLKV
jgi:hypothetical protein